ncbi:MAG: CRISPR-associated endonuclease Cas3'', partial [Desulfovibrio sp.]|nr:CRISPR-associated endonuclease Cas3'' [Desulfovibrio sp.]
MEQQYYLWGKRDKETGCRHPLLAHLADVGAVMEKMLLLPVFRQRMGKALGKILTPVLRERLCVLACLHDLGKFAPGFQLRLRKYDHQYCLQRDHQDCNHIDSLYGLLQQRDRLLKTFPWLEQWGAAGGVVHAWLLAAFS